MKINPIVLLITVLVTVIISVISSRHFAKSKGVPFIKLLEVYDSFEMTKELEMSFKQIERAKKNILDSMEFIAKSIANIEESKNDSYKKYVEEYINKRREFENSNNELSKKYEEQIWNHINSYSKEYGKKMKYEYIIGAQGSGIIMYADEKNDITKDFIKFINNRYNGEKK